MTGIEKITNQITQEAEQAALEELTRTTTDCAAIIESAKSEAKKEAEKIIENAKRKASEIEGRAISSAQFDRRNRLLKFKQDYIENVIEWTKTDLSDLDDKEYFAALLELVKIHSRKGNTVICFNKKDLTRVPSDFEAKAFEITGQKASLHADPYNISSGFVLLYDGIDINCSFEKIFESMIDDLRDAAGKILFPVKKEIS